MLILLLNIIKCFKENLFIWYEIWRKNVKNNIFVKYVTEAHV